MQPSTLNAAAMTIERFIMPLPGPLLLAGR
jgi:hypothetical protein